MRPCKGTGLMATIAPCVGLTAKFTYKLQWLYTLRSSSLALFTWYGSSSATINLPSNKMTNSISRLTSRATLALFWTLIKRSMSLTSSPIGQVCRESATEGQTSWPTLPEYSTTWWRKTRPRNTRGIMYIMRVELFRMELEPTWPAPSIDNGRRLTQTLL